MAIIGSSFDFLMCILYIVSIKRFFALFNVHSMPFARRYFKYVFYNLLEFFIIFRIIFNIATIIVWVVIIFGDLSAAECQYFTKEWIGHKMLIAGYINAFIPNYAALVIIYVLNFFGS
jgi:hypothetical protein